MNSSIWLRAVDDSIINIVFWIIIIIIIIIIVIITLNHYQLTT